MRKIAIILIVTLFAASLEAQEDAYKTCQKLFREAYEEYHKKGKYDEAISKYKEILKITDSLKLKPEKTQCGVACYNIACIYAVQNEEELAFEWLFKAVDNGYNEYDWIAQDPDLIGLRDNPKFKKLIDYAKSKALIIEMIEYKNESPLDSNLFLFDRYDNPKLKKLKDEYKLKEIVSSSETEFDKFLLLLDWVYRQWEHGPTETPTKSDALTILKEAKEGKHFRCVEYSIVLAQCLCALGYPARTVRLRKKGSSFGWGKGHVVTEVYSNQYDKWVLLDGQTNAYWKKDGLPLNAAEVRRYWLEGREVKFVGQCDWDYVKLKSFWIKYFYHLRFYPRNDFFSKESQGYKKHEYSHYELLYKENVPELLFQGQPKRKTIFTHNYSICYPTLNHVDIRLEFEELSTPVKSIFKVTLKNSMPWFCKYMTRKENGEWEKCESNFKWTLKPGVNELMIKGVNKFDVESIPNVIKIKWYGK